MQQDWSKLIPPPGILLVKLLRQLVDSSNNCLELLEIIAINHYQLLGNFQAIMLELLEKCLDQPSNWTGIPNCLEIAWNSKQFNQFVAPIRLATQIAWKSLGNTSKWQNAVSFLYQIAW